MRDPLCVRIAYRLEDVADILRAHADEHGHVPRVIADLNPRPGAVVQFADGVAELVFPVPPIAKVREQEDRDDAIIRMKDVESLSFDKIGEHFDISRERVRQLYKRAKERPNE